MSARATSKRTSMILALTCLLAGSACGAGQLAPKFAPPETPTEAKVAENIARAAPREERAVAVGALADAPNLAAWDLRGGLLWELPVQVKSAPLVVGDAVVLREAAGVMVRDLATGAVRVKLGAGELVGADAVGDVVAISLAFKNDASSYGVIALVAGDRVRWKKELSQPAGTPALVENQVLVPWGTQRLSVLSAQDGTELARWNFRNMVSGQALVDRGQVFVGQFGLLKVEKDLPAHQDGPLTLLTPAKRSLPGQPPLLRDGYAPIPEPDHASHRVKVEWRPGLAPASVEGDQVVFRYYRLAFGLAAQQDEVRWVRSFDHDLVGSATQPGGVFLADEQGVVRFVDPAGVTRFKLELKKRLRVLSLRPGTFAPVSESQPALESPEASLHDQLFAAATLDDDRLFPGRALAVSHLARTGDARVTAELIGLCTRKNGVGNLAQAAACDELGKREGNGPDILQALRQRGSFLEGTSAPPVGALAQAAARSKLKAAGPLLQARAEDPNTPASELVPLFQAIEALAYAPAIAQIERFVRLHHAEPAGSDLTPAIHAALEVLGKMRAKNSRFTLESVANDQLNLEPVRQKAKEALALMDAPPAKPEQAKAEPNKAKQTAERAPVLTDPRPYALASQDVQKAFRPLHAALVRCIEADASKPKSARISMIVTGAGKMEGFVVTPTSLQGCTDAILRNAKFPETRLSRQHVIQTVYLPQGRAAATATKAQEPAPKAAPSAPSKPSAAGKKKPAP